MPSLDESFFVPGTITRVSWIQTRPPSYNNESGTWVPEQGYFHTEQLDTQAGFRKRQRSSTRSGKPPYIRSQPYYYYELAKTYWHGSKVEMYVPQNPWENRFDVSSSGAGYGGPFTRPYGFESASLASIEDLASKVANKLLAKVASQDLNLGNAIGERKQTMELIRSTATAVVHGLRGLRSGRLAKDIVLGMHERVSFKPGWVPPSSMPKRERIKRSLKLQAERKRALDLLRRDTRRVAQASLVYHYGVLPLLSDVYGASENFRKRFLEGQTEVISVRTGASDSVNTSFVDSSPPLLTVGSGTIQRHVKAGVKFRVSNPVLRDLQQIGLVNPLSIAWELTPWSFVADWFVGVGKFIELQTATAGCTFVDGYQTTRDAWFGVATATRNNPVGSRVDAYQLDCAERGVEIRRTRLDSFPSPRLERGTGISSETRAIEAVSLAITNLRFFK